MHTLDYKGKSVIVTGAGSGIGRASALRFGELGASVVVCDIDASAARSTVETIQAAQGICVECVADVTDPGQVDGVVALACDRYGRLDVMFNNCGGSFPTPMLEIDTAEYRRLMALNLDSVYFGTMAALRVMLPQGGGAIVSTTSGAGLGAVSGLAVYGAAKAGVISLMRSVAAEYGKQGIRANTISPGAMDTPGMRRWLDTTSGGVAGYNDAQPQGRMGRAEEIADAAVFLASDFASYINGVVLPVDGAVSALLANPQ